MRAAGASADGSGLRGSPPPRQPGRVAAHDGPLSPCRRL